MPHGRRVSTVEARHDPVNSPRPAGIATTAATLDVLDLG
jgi:hypothetical protein